MSAKYILKLDTPKRLERARTVFDGVRAGLSPKEIGRNAGITRSQTYHYLSHLGYVPVYLSPTERQAVRHMRNNDNLTYAQHAGNA